MRRVGRPKGRKVTRNLTITVTPQRHAAWEAALKVSGLRAVDFYGQAIDEAAKKAESVEHSRPSMKHPHPKRAGK